ncbi:hypothetical protein FRC03_009453 [Tulasnella sp. 419]|nr:hypothetical protein FRC03_009453 [Tulasnella sp. 419]
MPNPIAGPAASALSSLTPSQIQFIRDLPKAELHAHLNGSIPISCLQLLAKDRLEGDTTTLSDVVQKGLKVFEREEGVTLDRIDDFFTLFPAIYALTSTRECLMTATRAVLVEFLGPVDGSSSSSECTYLELRTTPRDTTKAPEAKGQGMTRREYLDAVLDEVERYDKDRAALIISVDRRMSPHDVDHIVELAKSLKSEGRRVVGVDLCGDPLQGNMEDFMPILCKVNEASLGLTLHIAETTSNTSEDTNTLLACNPSRLGHATFLNNSEQATVLEKKMAIEICLTSNLL